MGVLYLCHMPYAHLTLMVQPRKYPYTTEVTRRGAVAARRAHNPKVSGSNPLAATNVNPPIKFMLDGGIFCAMETNVMARLQTTA